MRSEPNNGPTNSPPESAPVTEPEAALSLVERIEQALVLLALFIELDGDVYLPMYEKFEAELAELKKHQDTKERARQRLISYKRSGALIADNSKNLSFNSSDGPRPYLGL